MKSSNIITVVKFFVVILWLFLFAFCYYVCFGLLTKSNTMLNFSAVIFMCVLALASVGTKCGTTIIDLFVKKDKPTI